MEIKPLKWEKDRQKLDCLVAKSSVAEYQINVFDFETGRCSLHKRFILGSMGMDYPTVTAAKIAAEEDYKSRVLSMIETEPHPRKDGEG